ncbi:MAG: amidohydrolase [Candidatus Hydrogenedentes bacterium]|nr:amidohydrolase [Candidatus Hydrogenedentota bacterium]
MKTVIDVHTHMLSNEWVGQLEAHGGPRYSVKEVAGGQRAVHLDGAPFMTLTEGMFDYDLRVKNMNKAGVDLAVVSLTCPNVFWGGPKISTDTARLMNDDMAQAQRAHPDRIRWFASLPWQFPEAAVAELERAHEAGAVGVMVLGNIAGRALTDPSFAPIWQAIDRKGLPVLVHPTVPPGLAEMDMGPYNLVASTGFLFDTTLAVVRMIFDGFFDRHPNLKLIASHGGGTLPYIVGRLDQCYDNMPACREKIGQKPSAYLRRIYLDSVVYRQEALELCLAVCGDENVLYGSDYPHNIGDMVGCLARVDALPAVRRDRVRGGNAERIFGL